MIILTAGMAYWLGINGKTHIALRSDFDIIQAAAKGSLKPQLITSLRTWVFPKSNGRGYS